MGRMYSSTFLNQGQQSFTTVVLCNKWRVRHFVEHTGSEADWKGVEKSSVNFGYFYIILGLIKTINQKCSCSFDKQSHTLSKELFVLLFLQSPRHKQLKVREQNVNRCGENIPDLLSRTLMSLLVKCLSKACTALAFADPRLT